MLKVKSSARIKRRYLLISANSREQIENAILEGIGVLGWAEASPVFVSVKKANGFVLSIERAALDKVRASFSIAANAPRILKVSGTLRGLS